MRLVAGNIRFNSLLPDPLKRKSPYSACLNVLNQGLGYRRRDEYSLVGVLPSLEQRVDRISIHTIKQKCASRIV